MPAKLFRFAVVALFVWTLASGLEEIEPAEAGAQDHNLEMRDVSVDPDPLNKSCSNDLTPKVNILGEEDHTVSSGDAEVTWAWVNANNWSSTSEVDSDAWNQFGTWAITYDKSNGPFAIGRTWPDDFPSMQGRAYSWTPQTRLPGAIYLKAEVNYRNGVDITDDEPSNNRAYQRIQTEASDCKNGGGRCEVFSKVGLTLCGDDQGLVVSPGLKDCLRDRELCKPNPIPTCKIAPDCPGCLKGLTCPDSEFDIWATVDPELGKIEVIGRDGEVVGRGRRLSDAVEVDGQTFRQILKFEAERGVDYKVRVVPSEKARIAKESYPLEIRVRPSGKGFEDSDVGSVRQDRTKAPETNKR